MPIGEIAGVAPGSTFTSRRELYDAGVHRALQAGIVGAASTGAESVVLSGGSTKLFTPVGVAATQRLGPNCRPGI
jgi:SAD/SRA domain